MALVNHSANAATYQVGPGKIYAKPSLVPVLKPGDIVEIYSGAYVDYKRWTVSGTSVAPITIRGMGATRPVIDGSGLNLSGVLPVPRALFQIEASYYVIENIEFKNGRNSSLNGAGIRITAGTNATIRNCKITYCDMGMMSNSNDNLIVEQSEVAFNGRSGDPYSHNFYLGGNRTTIRACYIHDSITGQNFKTRGHYTELLYNYIANSADGEVGLVDNPETATANSNAVMIGNTVISKVRASSANAVRFIDFGQDGGGAHSGTLYAINNTFIAGTTRIDFLRVSAASAKCVATNNIFYGSDSVVGAAGGGVTGNSNWASTTAIVPAALTNTKRSSAPGFVNAAAQDYHLTATATCRNAGVNSPAYFNGSGISMSGVPQFEYLKHTQLVARGSDGALDIGAYENASVSTLPTVTITASDATATEAAGNPGVFTITRSGSTTAALTVNFMVSGTATNGGDYASIGTSLSIPAGAVSATVNVTPLEDTSVESSESVTLTLASSAAYTLGSPAGASVTIADNDVLPSVSVVATDASGTETAGNTITYTFTRTGSTAAALTVNFSTFGTATSGSDYASLGTSTVIPAGAGSATKVLTPTDDTLQEPNETVVLAISASAAYTVSGSAASSTITDNDFVTIAATDSSAAESAGNSATFTITRVGSTAASLTVNFAMSGTAASGADYASFNNSVTIAAGSASASVVVTPIDDTLVEGSETVVLTLGAGAYSIGAPGSASASIVDNDTLPTVSVAAIDANASEPGADKGAFMITRTGATTTALTVNFSVGGTATSGSDYTSLGASATIAAGAASAVVSVAPLDDASIESNETVVLTITPLAAYAIGASSSATVNIASDDVNTTTSVTLQDGLNGYAGTTDTYLDQFQPATNFGATAHFEVRWYNDGVNLVEMNKALLRFNLSSIPSNATINSATLTVYNLRANSNSSADIITMNKVTGAWSESSTWNSGVPASVSSGVTCPTVAGYTGAPVTPEAYTINNMTALVQGWVSTPASNLGVIFTTDSNLNFRLASSEYTTVQYRPALTIQYTTPGGAAAAFSGNTDPQISSASATPDAATVGAAVSFNAAASDAEGDALEYLWDFGDGTTGAGSSVVHTYAVEGLYAASISVLDGNGGSAIQNISVSVSGATQITAPARSPGTVSALSGSVRFNISGTDACVVAGSISGLPADFNLEGAQVRIDVGGATADFTISKDKGKSGASAITMRLKNGVVSYKVALKRGNFAQVWADEGIAANAPATFVVDVTIGDKVFTSAVETTVVAKPGIGAKFKK
jgi:hypothetical protein